MLNDAVEWLGGGEHPDNGTKFSVQYVFTNPSGISDVNPGSVVRTLAEAISREIEFLYLQMEQAYLSGFLDTANGVALDFVVSILGIKRKPPQPSSGVATFGRNNEPELLTISGEVHLWDGSIEYVLNKPQAKEVTKIEGTASGAPTIFEKDIDYTLAGNKLKWLSDGKAPDAKTVFQVDYTAYRQITIPKGTNVATFSLKSDEIRKFLTIEDASLTLTSDGKWTAEIPVECTMPGRAGNVLAGTIVVMPQPVQGVEYVINKGDVTNGVESESDNELRQRATHALEFAGKATNSSLESAIRSIKGVRSLLIEDMPDDVPGIVKAIVDGGETEKISQVINDTKAAGVRVEFVRPQIVYIDVSMELMLHKAAQPSIVTSESEKKIRSYISTLNIGEDVLFSRIVESVVSIDGVWDVSNIIIEAHRSDGSVIESDRDNIEISHEERAEPQAVRISYIKRNQ